MQKELEATNSLKRAELKELASATGPCLTLFVPLEHGANQTRFEEMRLNAVLRQAEQRLEQMGHDKGEIRQLLEPLSGLAASHPGGTNAGDTLVALRSPEVFRVIEIPQRFDETAYVGKRFHVRPLLGSLQDNELEFFLLALSQNHARLLRCTTHDSHEVPFPPGVPTSLQEWLGTRLPSSPPDQSVGDQGGNFTSTSDRDNKDPHVANFFRAISKGLHDMLRNESIPMVIVGVEYEIAAYHDVNTYEHLLKGGVQGSPDGLKGGEMHKRALEIVREHSKEPLQKALQTYERLGGSERVSSKPVDIVKGAAQGRVAFLLLDENCTLTGTYNDDTMDVKQADEGEDLVNVAALHTIAYGGEIMITPAAMIPGQNGMAAIFRF